MRKWKRQDYGRVVVINSNLKSFVQTQLQTGSVANNNYEQIYENNGYTSLSFTSYNDSTGRSGYLTVYGSNNGSSWTTLLSSNVSGTANISNYKYIKLVTSMNPDGYGSKFTYSLSLS